MIKAEDLKWYKAEEMSNTPTNGGPMSAIEIPNGVKNDVFEDVTEDDRSEERVHLRKIYICNTSEKDTLLDAKVYVVTPEQEGLDSLTFTLGTPDDRQADVQPGRRYGCAKLLVSTRAGAPYLVVSPSACDTPPDGEIFHEGDLVRLSDYEGGEFLRITSVDYGRCIATLEMQTPMSRIYTGGKAWVSSVYEHGDLKPGEAIPVWECRRVLRGFGGGTRKPVFTIIGDTEE